MGGARELPPSGGEIGTPNSQNSAPRRLDINLAPQPVLKIEVFSKATLDSLMTFNILATTICAGIILRISTTSPEALGRGWIVLAGVMQTIGALTFFFLLVAYPQRILRKWRSPNEFPLPEQLILIGIIILSVANPYFSLWGTVSFWTTYQRTIESFGLLSKNATLDWSFGQEFIDDAGFSTVQLHAIIGGCTLYLFSCVLGILVGVLHHSLSEEESFYLMGIKTKDSDALGTTSETNLHRLSTNRFYLAPPGQTCGEYGDSHDDLLRLVRQRVEGSSLQRAKHYDAFLKFQTLDLLNILLTCILIVLKIIPSISLSFIPSVLPNVQVITVCRVCLHSLNSMHPYCKPGSISFTRAMWQIGISVLELGHLYILFRLYRRCGLSLTRVPYALWRGQIISFLFYKSLATSTIVIVLIMAALLASVPNVYFWVNRYDNENREPVADPLFQIGITGMNFGIYFTAYVLVKPTLTLAIAFLPADSDGLLGFFCGREEYLHACGNKELDKEENRANAMASPEPDESRPGLMRASSAKNKRLHFQSLWFRRNWNHEEDEFDQEEIRNAYIQLYDELVWDKQERPVYIMLESTVRNLINTLHISDEREWSGIDVLSRQASSKLTELWRERLCPATENEKPFLRQIRDVNVFVLESEMTMFNFSCASYYLGTEANPKTPEEESMLLEDQKYKYIKHIYDAPTDTHCLVAHSSDRLIFAFRGTVSEQNAKTDLNLGLIPWDVANDPNAISCIGCPEEELISEKGMRAKVHEGFHKAYYNIRHEILELVEQLALSARKNPGCQIRAVCCTGHSLGGALATVAAFDIALSIGKATQRNHVAVSCTTFGSPRVGNFVFSKRFNALIPKSYRFVNAKDFIPKTPVKNLFSKFTLNGYFHVGRLVMLSNDGSLIINPASIEKYLRSGLYRKSAVAHTTRSYAFSFLCWNIRAHWREWKPNIWAICTDRIGEVVRSKKNAVDPIILGRLREFMHGDGHKYKLGNHHVRNRATQVEAVECTDETAVLLRDFENYLRDDLTNNDQVTNVVEQIKSLIYAKDSMHGCTDLG